VKLDSFGDYRQVWSRKGCVIIDEQIRLGDRLGRDVV
jgi:hypothetical protein